MKYFVVSNDRRKERVYLAPAGAKNILSSFYYINKGYQPWALVREPSISLMIDSGAHSFRMARGKASRFSLTKFAEYYIEFIRKFQGLFHSFAELDLEEVVGQVICDRWFEQLKAVAPKLRCIRVWHPWHGFDRWKLYCKQTDYVGIGGGWNTRNRVSRSILTKLVHYAYERGVKVHAFGCTSVNFLYDIPFYSVDSSSWVAGEMYGKAYELKGGQLVQHDLKNNTGTLKQLNEYSEITLQNLKVFLEFETFLTELWKERGIVWNET